MGKNRSYSPSVYIIFYFHGDHILPLKRMYSIFYGYEHYLQFKENLLPSHAIFIMVRQKRMKWIKLISWMVSMGVTLLLLLASYSYYFNPNQYPLFSFLGLFFFVPLLLSLLTFLFLCIICRKSVLPILVGWVLSLGSIKSFCPLHFDSDGTKEEDFKVMTYNVHRYDIEGKTEEGFKKVKSIIDEVSPDFCCIQEGMPYKMLSSSKKSTLHTAFPEYPYCHWDHYGYNKRSHICINFLSKYPILSYKYIPCDIPNSLGTAISFVVKMKKRNVNIVVLHLQSNNLPEDMYNSTFNRWKGFFKSYLRSACLRSQHSKSIEKFLQGLEGEVVVCGDFNDTQFSHAYHIIKRNKLSSAFDEKGLGPGVTFNDRGIFFRIDHILHSQGLKTSSCKVFKRNYSDHYPVVAGFRFEE
ncbi:MAG TPA: hypothetical protein DDY68_00510 [Porphyromonadaceae bacterium]|nr:hypothetical protein [Porphyromonadaceae bacterium]